MQPGSTRAVRASGSMSMTWCRWREKSMQTATLQPWPARLVPPPRATIGASCSRQMRTASTTSSPDARIDDADRHLAIVGGIGRVERPRLPLEIHRCLERALEIRLQRLRRVRGIAVAFEQHLPVGRHASRAAARASSDQLAHRVGRERQRRLLACGVPLASAFGDVQRLLRRRSSAASAARSDRPPLRSGTGPASRAPRAAARRSCAGSSMRDGADAAALGDARRSRSARSSQPYSGLPRNTICSHLIWPSALFLMTMILTLRLYFLQRRELAHQHRRRRRRRTRPPAGPG